MGQKCRKYLCSFLCPWVRYAFYCTDFCETLKYSSALHEDQNWTKGVENMVRITVGPLGQVCLSLHQCSWISYLAKWCQLEIYTEFNPNMSRNTEITDRNSFTPWSKLWPSTALSFMKLMLAGWFFFLWRASLQNFVKILKMVIDRRTWSPRRQLFLLR